MEPSKVIQYPGFQFASPPRTGTAWFTKYAHSIGLGERTRSNVHFPHEVTSEPRLTIVRHPCDWLASYFLNVYPACLCVPCVDIFRLLPGMTFDCFVAGYLKKHKGAIGDMFAAYNATDYIRLEDVPVAADTFIHSIGIKTQKIQGTPIAANTSRTMKPLWDRSLWQDVMESEKEYVQKYGY